LEPSEQRRKLTDAGGTSGGLGEFLVGFAMAVAGGYMLTNSVTVSSGYWTLWGYNSFGLSLVPMVFGVGLLFFNGGSTLGWLLLYSSLILIAAGIIMNLSFYFHPTSLFNTIVMFVLVAGGIGLVAKALRPH
jgi:hypothetical protein